MEHAADDFATIAARLREIAALGARVDALERVPTHNRSPK